MGWWVVGMSEPSVVYILELLELYTEIDLHPYNITSLKIFWISLGITQILLINLTPELDWIYIGNNHHIRMHIL